MKEKGELITVLTWIDGDTFDGLYQADVSLETTFALPWSWRRKIAIKLSGDAQVPVKVRCDGIDAPELHGETRTAGLFAKQYAEKICPAGTLVRIVTVGSGNEKYGRWLGRVTLPNGDEFAARMIAAGHATEYHGGKRP